MIASAQASARRFVGVTVLIRRKLTLPGAPFTAARCTSTAVRCTTLSRSAALSIMPHTPSPTRGEGHETHHDLDRRRRNRIGSGVGGEGPVQTAGRPGPALYE